jgi:DNA polymerase III subunit gamma/tau
MDYLVSARKWRPKTFGEVIGQQHVAQTLTNAIRQGRTAHAYLFSGGRGVGKTTMARILAKALNCEKGPTPDPCGTCAACEGIVGGSSPDVIEIDGASNRGIDEVRELRETVRYTPMQGRYRVYIIDEVHMLTKEAFNALLKTLEEPPGHVVFIMATTEVHKIPSTILSRCQHFSFRRMTRQEIMGQLDAIAKKEEIGLSPGGSAALARIADGSMRDALSLLDQATAFSGKTVTEKDLESMLGTPSREVVTKAVAALLSRRADAALEMVNTVMDRGFDLRQFSGELVEQFRNLMVAKLSKEPSALIDLPAEEVAALSKTAAGASQEELQRLFGIFAQTLEALRSAAHPRFILEMAVVRACEMPSLESVADLLEKVERLEKNLPEGAPSPPTGRARRSEVRSREEPVAEPLPEDDAAVPKDEPPGPALAGPAGQWMDVIHRIRDVKPSLASYLEGCRLIGMRDNVITLGFEDRTAFFVDLIKKEENLRLVRDTVKKLLGLDAQIKFEEGKGEAPPPRRAEEAKKKERAKEENTLSDPIVKEAINLFGGEIVEIREAPGS